MRITAALLALVLIVSAAKPLWACPEPSTEEQIMLVFGEEEYEMARCVAWHESRLVSTARNPETGTSGSFQIHPGWKGVMAREGLDVVILICANRSYRILQVELARAGVAEPGPQARGLTSLESPALDWVALAKGYGVPASQVDTAGALAEALERGLREPGPQLVEMLV